MSVKSFPGGHKLDWEGIENVPSFVKSVNGVTPDENGNIAITIPDSSQNGDGLTAAEKSLILSLFKNAAYTADMSVTIAQLENLWSGGTVEPEPDEPDEPVNPDVWYEHFNENNLVDPAGQNSFVTVDGVRYYRYYAGANNFEYPMTNQQPGEVIVTLRAIPQYVTSLDSGIWLYYDDGTSYKIQVIQAGSSNGTITYTTPADKTLTKLTGNYDMEGWVLLDMSVMSIQAKYPPAEAESSGVWQVGNTLSVVSGVTATQNGSVLAIA